MPFPQSLLVFDIETVPDLETGKRLYPNLAKLSDADTLSALTAIRQSEAGNAFMRPPLPVCHYFGLALPNSQIKHKCDLNHLA